MVDKPSGKIEELLVMLCDWWAETRADAKEVLDAGAEPVKKLSKKHPAASKVLSACAAIFVCVFIIAGFAAPKDVIVKIDDSKAIFTSYYKTTAARVDSFIEQHDVDFDPSDDIIDVQMYEGIKDGMVINIIKPFDIPVKVDGQELVYHTRNATVGQIIEELGIEIGINDQINYDLDHQVKKGDEILISRVLIEYVVDEIKTGYAVKYVADSSMTIGDTEVKQKGQKGLQKKTYLTVTIDGEEVSRTLMESETIQKKKDKIVHYGTKILSGVPKGLKYKEKFSRVRAVSYWYSTQRRGVYGMPCAYGTCAVDRDLIPLGSLLYIEGYGYAVANDVGTAIQGKTVDLYMERLGQCGIWGARWTNVYVLEYGDDTAFWER